MRNKNTILALIAITFATGSAFTSNYWPYEDAYVWVKRWNETKYTCMNTGFECDRNYAPYTCQVVVFIDIPSDQRIVAAHNSRCNAFPLRTDVIPELMPVVDFGLGDVVDAID